MSGNDNIANEFAARTGEKSRLAGGEFERVFKFFDQHKIRLEKMRARNPGITIFATDINGTLDHYKWGPKIDRFLSDMHDRGASVKIISGLPSNDLDRYEIACKLAQGNISILESSKFLREPWFMSKPYTLPQAPSFMIDDDDMMGSIFKGLGGTYVHAKENNPELEILEIWTHMSETEKDIVAKNLLGDGFRLKAKPGVSETATNQPPQP